MQTCTGGGSEALQQQAGAGKRASFGSSKHASSVGLKEAAALGTASRDTSISRDTALGTRSAAAVTAM
jgi:hypothetical protein